MSEDFKIWWHREGSGMPPLKGEDTCEHVERVSAIAWSNGAYKATISADNEIARLKAEVERLKAEPDALTAYLYADTLRREDIKTLQAQVERLTKAGDEMLSEWASGDEKDAQNFLKALVIWNAAKEGKPSA